MFCPSCEAEYREGFTECGDCGVPLVRSLEPDEAERLAQELVPVHQTTSPDELAEIVDRFEKAEVPYVLQAGTALCLFDGRDEELPEVWNARLWVASDFEKRALRIVDQVRTR